MFDIQLRPLKDGLFDHITAAVPTSITPLQLTFAAFACGLGSCYSTYRGGISLALTLWALNRAFDCLDGAVARRRKQSSDLGGFLDLLGDFIVYSTIPIACALCPQSSQQEMQSVWLSVAVLEASFHVNNFVLFYGAAILEKQKTGHGDEKKIKELTSVAMRPALIEGFESAALFTFMLAFPQYLMQISWSMALLVSIGIVQRSIWLSQVL